MVRLERVDGDIDALITRLAHIRTWTYVAYRADWLDDALHWQERTRAVEDALSDALHERLTQRFVDRRTQALLKGLHGDGQLATIDDDGAIVVEGQAVGRVEGLRYTIQPTGVDIERRVLSAAGETRARPRAAQPGQSAARSRRRGLAAGRSRPHRVAAGARRRGAGRPAAAGPSPLVPRLELLVADSLHGPTRGAIGQRLGQWLDGHLAELTMPLRRLQAAELAAPGPRARLPAGRGHGQRARADRAAAAQGLGADDRARLSRLGVRFGVRHIYLASMLQPRAIEPAHQAVGDPAPHGGALPPGGRDLPGRRRPRPGSCRGERVRGARRRLACASTWSSVWPRACARWPAPRRSSWSWSCCA